MKLTNLYDELNRERLALWYEKTSSWLFLDETLDSLRSSKSVSNLRIDDILRTPEFHETSSLSLSELASLYAQICQRPNYPDEFFLTRDRARFAPLFHSVGKIICVGLNYSEHAKEFGDPLPDEPVIFNKAPSSLSFCGAPILLPKTSDRVDFEGELVVVIGKKGRDIPESRAFDYVAGYTCGNDVSARDWQKGKPAGQWFLGKSFDSFAPVGPFFATSDEILDPHGLDIRTRVNGQIMQDSNTRHFIFRIDRLISYVSQVMTLEPGDLLFTGTPSGVGDARRPPIYLRDGDVVAIEIDNLGELRNSVASSSR